MNRHEAWIYATKWAAAWNRLDVEGVLAHFAEEVVFTSPTAKSVVGINTVRGKRALRDYWNEAAKRVGTLDFEVDRILWDPVTRELAILYRSESGGHRKRVSENLTFNAAGLVISAEVFHGVIE